MQCHEIYMQCSYVCIYRIGLFREPVGVPLEVNAPAKTHGSNKSPGHLLEWANALVLLTPVSKGCQSRPNRNSLDPSS